MLTLNFYADPGHGWCAVKRDLLTKFNIADKISAYSYQRGNTVYLEEDCDLSTFMQAADANNIEVKFVHKHTNDRSPIRSYNRYVFA